MNFIFRLPFTVVLLLAFGFTKINAQKVIRKNTKDGILRARINSFDKDSLGFLWVGTNKGIYRYSGSEFRTYNIEKIITAKSLDIIDILNINGNVYAISPSGSVLKYQYEYDTFKEVLYKKKARFISIAKLNDNKILIGLTKGFIIYNIKTATVTDILHPKTSINREIIVSGNTIYVANGNSCNQYTFNNSKNSLTLSNTILDNTDVISIGLDKSKKLWIGTEVGGLYVFKNNNLKRVLIKKITDKTNAIRKITFDKNNNALIAIDRFGLFVIDSKYQVLNSFSHDINKPETISQNSIYEVYVDKDNAYWLGLREGGINVIYQKDNVFKEIKHILNVPQSISNNTVRSIYETNDGALWFGTENGLSKFYNNTWINFNKRKEFYNTAILSLNEYMDEFLVGSYGQSIFNFNTNTNTNKISKTSLIPEPTLNFIFGIHVFDDNLWLSSIDGPLHHYINKKLVFKYEIGLVRTLVKGFDEIYYAGTSKGFFQINKRNKSVRKLKPEIFNISNEVHALELDPVNNVIWVGGIKGIYKFNLQNETIENIGLNANKEIGTVFSIKKDNMNNLYLGAISGLWRYNSKRKLFRKYDEHDGLTIKQFGFGAAKTLQDGSFVFGGAEGAVIFNPYHFEKDNLISDIYISNLEINGDNPENESLKKNSKFLKEIDLEYNQNSISFNLETLKFHGSKRNFFNYKLIGYDKEFKKTFNNTKIIYANLSSGTYELKAIGFNADGVKAKKELSLIINIEKPFWKTTVAFLLYTTLGILITYLLLNIIKANNRKTRDEDRIKFFIEVAHDIRTPVSLIQLLLKQLTNQKDINKSIELIQRNSENLNQYVTQLLDFQKIDRNQLKLKVTRVDLKSCITDIVSDFSPLLQEKSIDITVNIKKIEVWFDKDKMNRIFYNLISNAIKYTNEGGQININAKIEDHHIHISFIDNGIGIPEKQQALIFKRFTRGTNVTNKGIPGTGIGLMLSKKIVELHSGQITIKSKENLGSEFTVRLPLGTQHYKEEDIVKETIVKTNTTPNIEKLITKDKLILLVEDTLDLRIAIKTQLDEDYTVLEAANGKEGLLIALSKNPDLVITDVMMPEMDGKELCNLLKTNFKTSHIPIIMLTSLVNEDDKLKGLKTGADAYVEKPFNLEILKATINNLIKSRENLSNLLEDKKVEKQLTPDERFLSEVIETIKENLTANDFSIDALCDKMGLSRSNMFRKLKGLIQMSPSDLIIKIKLSHAEEMMKSKKRTRISDIAYESGFNDPKYFSTLFKKHYQQTPKEFMDSH